MNRPIHDPKRLRVHRRVCGQHGFALVEALCAMLIFGVGVLGIARLQSVAVQSTSTAGFRTTASLLSKDLIGRMWLSDRTPATLQANFAGPGSSAGAGYTAWLATVTAAQLPGVATYPPQVTFAPATGGGTAPIATITIFWKAPGDTSEHKYVETAQVK